MSRWLQNVGTFLDKLDDQAEHIAQTNQEEDDDDPNVASILAARGLDDDGAIDSFDDGIDDMDLSMEQPDEQEEERTTPATPQEVQIAPQSAVSSIHLEEAIGLRKESPERPLSDETGHSNNQVTLTESNSSEKQNESLETPVVDQSMKERTPADAVDEIEKQLPRQKKEPIISPDAKQEEQESAEVPPSLSAQTEEKTAPVTTHKQPPTPAVMTEEAKQALKEVRVLRKHVVSLNKQLEAAEAEMSAQRDELEGAAVRMEKDRARNKEEKVKLVTAHGQEVSALQAQHAQALADQQQRADQQLGEVRQQLKNLESRRQQEGGDWHKELEDAIQREKEASEKLRLIEDEKATILAQTATLQSQQEALGSRIESLTQTTETAMEREREAEHRLDEVLSTHARQVAQRQAREAELERTVAEIGAALADERGKKMATGESSSEGRDGDVDISGLEQEIAALNEKLEMELQQKETLQNELGEVARERDDDHQIFLKRQQRYDQQIMELSQSLAKVKLELTESKNHLNETNHVGRGSEEIGEGDEVRRLSEELLQQRDSQSKARNEIAALKNRLQAATRRAEKAEEAVVAAETSDVELGGKPSLRRRGNSAGNTSIRSALYLGTAGGEPTQPLGRALDGLDIFLKESGKFLRFNPVARLLFILYLLLIHLWTFALVFMHAHSSFEPVGTEMSHGPHVLMQAGNTAAATNSTGSNP